VKAIVSAYETGRIEAAEPVFAVNLLLDMPARFRNAELAALKQRLGDGYLEGIEPIHALAGRFTMTCLRGRLRGAVTLSPDGEPGIQKLSLVAEEV
jgi:D-alanyl-D-alanine-carboxypeptidase/D-alanyl-D-alanine-endopeptidase